MTYEKLLEFINQRMRMSHIYQPVMLMTLLKNKGSCSQKEIAKALLAYDKSQIEYYEKITNNMVGRVLRSHEIVHKDKNEYLLKGFEDLSETEVQELISQCEGAVEEYIEKRGTKIWEHRKASSGYITGTLRYEVLKRSKFHCELCGVSADEKALEVDHILPRNNGGSDDLENLQSLCYSCNSMKRDRDDTDFRLIRESFDKREEDCLFCNISKERVVSQNSLAYVIRDGYPVTELHTLIIPYRHVETYFELGQSEINACTKLLDMAKQEIESLDNTVKGFNIGINNGHCAGQTIYHCHIHLIPRRDGDVDNPRGGVRHIIPDKGYY
jgi:ATP adenylyltransferase